MLKHPKGVPEDPEVIEFMEEMLRQKYGIVFN
jgi:hypothetical protein